MITHNGSSLEQNAQFRCFRLLEGTEPPLSTLGLTDNAEAEPPQLSTLVLLLDLIDK